jgi:26S proteasome regulatory subunit (ATPase 3-interacting protein)
MDTSIATLKDSLPTLKSTLKHLTTKLTTLRSAPTTSELSTMVTKLLEENKAKGEKSNGFKDGSVKMVTREEVERVDREFRYWGQKRGARKNAFGNLEGVLLEGMSREEVWERAGVEGDVY